jgi:hypothetical protein
MQDKRLAAWARPRDLRFRREALKRRALGTWRALFEVPV